MNNTLSSGLRVEPKDERDLKLGSFTTLPDLKELPDEFCFEPLEVKDQGASDKCSAYATCAISELQEGVVLDPNYSFAVSKSLSGDKDGWGQSLSHALKAHTKVGAVPKGLAPVLDDNQSRDIKNYPNLSLRALQHAKKSYVECDGKYDYFDNVRASIWKYRNEKRAAVMGLDWHWSLNEYVLDGISDSGFGHLVAIIGWTKEGLVLLNSAGPSSGRKGKHILPRAEANYYIEKYNGAFMFIDHTPEEIKRAIQEGKKIDEKNKLIKILQTMVAILQKFLQIK